MASTQHFVNPQRIKAARLAANMSRADLAFAIRKTTDGTIKATERGVAGWERMEYAPSDGVVPAIASATGKSLSFFYETDPDDEEPSRAMRVARIRQALAASGNDDLVADLEALAGVER